MRTGWGTGRASPPFSQSIKSQLPTADVFIWEPGHSDLTVFLQLPPPTHTHTHLCRIQVLVDHLLSGSGSSKGKAAAAAANAAAEVAGGLMMSNAAAGATTSAAPSVTAVAATLAAAAAADGDGAAAAAMAAFTEDEEDGGGGGDAQAALEGYLMRLLTVRVCLCVRAGVFWCVDVDVCLCTWPVR